MQAIVETFFDAVYLVSVITIGILMIRGCKGSHQFKLFGLMAVVLALFSRLILLKICTPNPPICLLPALSALLR